LTQVACKGQDQSDTKRAERGPSAGRHVSVQEGFNVIKNVIPQCYGDIV